MFNKLLVVALMIAGTAQAETPVKYIKVNPTGITYWTTAEACLEGPAYTVTNTGKHDLTHLVADYSSDWEGNTDISYRKEYILAKGESQTSHGNDFEVTLDLSNYFIVVNAGRKSSFKVTAVACGEAFDFGEQIVTGSHHGNVHLYFGKPRKKAEIEVFEVIEE